MKNCKNCRIDKDLEEFSKYSGNRGYRTICKKCRTEVERETKKKWYQVNKETELSRMKLWKIENSNKWNEYMREYHKRDTFTYKTPNNRFNRAKYRALLEQCTPIWLDEDHSNKIKEIYILCDQISRETEIKHQVDHIYPINNKILSGLHVWWNLQILPEKTNKSKSNKIENIIIPRVSNNFNDYLLELKIYADLARTKLLELADKKPLG